MTAAIARFGIIIGAQKCGTTALFQALGKHPEICASNYKETEFFARHERFAEGAEWYLNLFPWDSNRHRIAVEASPSYAMNVAYPSSVLRMRRTGWSFRFIYLVRDPVERIRSHYLHGEVVGMGVRPLSEKIEPFPIQLSRYYTQLLPYRGEFGRDPILVLSQDEMKADPDGTLSRVFHHFGVEQNQDIKLEVSHTGEYHYHRALLIQELRARGPVPETLSLDTVYEFLSTLNADEREAIETRVRARYTLTEAHREQVHRELADDMYLLHADYGIDVAKWGFKT